jgi:hypothetical protein
MAYVVEGYYEGEPAWLIVGEGNGPDGVPDITGWPTAAVIDAQDALVEAEIRGEVAGTPTGPFYKPDDPIARRLVVSGCLERPSAGPGAPAIPDYGYELPDLEEELGTDEV